MLKIQGGEKMNNKFQEFMKNKKVGVNELAKVTGFTTAYISAVKVGKKKMSPKLFGIICKEYQLTIEERHELLKDIIRQELNKYESGGNEDVDFE